MKKFDKAMGEIENKLKGLRQNAANRKFDPTLPAEVEINKFWFENETIDRIMVVLRSTGCSHYNSKQGCSMCAHYDGTTDKPVTSNEYIAQWKNILSGNCIDSDIKFDINNYPVLCLYNLGSFLNPEEVPLEAMKEIFSSINSLKGIKKTIIESRAEYITPEILKTIREVNGGLIEVGIGLESVNYDVRELCHHKNLPDLNIFSEAIKNLHDYDFKALVYINQKPPFLTESESIDDAISTSQFALENGADAISIEPTSLQKNSLVELLYNMGQYRVPWLWSVREVVKGIYESGKNLDIRIGGYFDEEILSGSQGVAPGIKRNELFPHQTSSNCSMCTNHFIKQVKEFNKTYDLDNLTNIKECKNCYHIWQDSLKIKDSRDIPQRILDIL
jgi:archaeosine synthase beta-subunit